MELYEVSYLIDWYGQEIIKMAPDEFGRYPINKQELEKLISRESQLLDIKNIIQPKTQRKYETGHFKRRTLRPYDES